MKVAVEVLSTNSEPSLGNIAAMKKTFVKLANEASLKNHYDFFFYCGGDTAVFPDSVSPISVTPDTATKNCYIVAVACDETIYNTYEKGIYTLKYTDGYDWYVRINISCYLNILLLDSILSQLDTDTVYCNALNTYINDESYFNDIYPRGDMMIFSEKTRQGILQNSKKYMRCDLRAKNRLNIPHVDDCLFGLCIIDYFGKKYFDHLQMLQYNYLPKPKIEPGTYSTECVGSRVKTVPPGISYSGYSWENNEYRKYDAEKMEYLYTAFKDCDYKNIKLKNLISTRRPTIFITVTSQNIDTIKSYLRKRAEA